jgi:circadian clock protein KaiB
MANPKPARSATGRFEQALRRGALHYDLRLYVAGMGPNSARAIENVDGIIHELLQGACTLTVIDIYDDVAAAREAQIVAVPALVRCSPPPVRKLVGDLSNRSRVIRFLDLNLISREGQA